jgi:hypothetical protein
VERGRDAEFQPFLHYHPGEGRGLFLPWVPVCAGMED